jgi:predicted short-subunit dehydrogenase-like oxidoreductase (DUF2520 family)
MGNPEIRSVVIMGSGNIAWHMGNWLTGSGILVSQVFSRNAKNGVKLAAELKTEFTNRLDHLNEHADLYVLAFSDDALASIIRQTIFGTRLAVHLAGSVPMEIFSGKVKNYGVLYPLQTFTMGKPVEYGQIPLFIEANHAKNLERIRKLAGRMSRKVYEVDSEKRTYLHLAAVIASNFTNHMLAVAEKLVSERNLSFDLLKPLIQETIAKAFLVSPVYAQTGPASRGNAMVIDKHMDMLEKHPEIRELYRVVTESIRAMRRLEQ